MGPATDILLDLLNEIMKKDEMQGFAEHFIALLQQIKCIDNIEKDIFEMSYHMTPAIF